MIEVKSYCPSDFEPFLEFCKEESKGKSPAAANMWVEGWEKIYDTILFILKNNSRFIEGKGKFFLLLDDNKIIGCSGIYISDFSPKVALAGTRTWINQKYRNLQLVKNLLLPAQKEWAIENQAEVIACSFNEYNKNLITLFTRGQNIGTRGPKHLFYKNFNKLDFLVTIQYVPQWVIFENLGEFQFNWDSIRTKNDR